MGAPLQKKNQVVQWSLHYKKKESGRAMKSSLQKKESGRVPFTDSKWSSVEVEMELRFYHTKSQWSSELYLNSIWCPTTTFRQPQALPYSRPPPTNNHATTPWSFFVCSMFPIPNIHIRIHEGPRNLLSGRGKAQLFLHSIPLPATRGMCILTWLLLLRSWRSRMACTVRCITILLFYSYIVMDYSRVSCYVILW